MTIAFIELTFEDDIKALINVSHIIRVDKDEIELIDDTTMTGYKETYAEVIQMIRQMGMVRSVVSAYGGYND